MRKKKNILQALWIHVGRYVIQTFCFYESKNSEPRAEIYLVFKHIF